jgi:hypothetical protein
MMNKPLFLTLTFLFSGWVLFSQVAVNRTGSSPHPSSVMELSSTEAGFLMPKLTVAQRVALNPPPEGLIIYQTENPKGYYYGKGGAWARLNDLETYRNEVQINISPAAPFITGNGTFASTGISVTDGGQGILNVSHPNLGNVPVKIITPVYNETPNPPVIPNDLCTTAFTNNCGTSGTWQHSLVVGVISPPSLGNASNPVADFRLCRNFIFGGNSCNNGTTDYFNYTNGNIPVPFKCSWVASAYNNNAGIDPGASYELFLRGNNSTTNLTALSVFVDWNQDADFFDPGEAVFNSVKKVWPASYRSLAELQGPYIVPASAVTGSCAMRVIASDVANNNQPCLTQVNGSAQDYTFFVSNGSAPTYPAENFHCSFSNETTSSFKVRCYDDAGSPVSIATKVHILIQPY